MGSYQIGQRVEATVERIETYGVFARLEDETQAYIRCRELGLDADVDPTELVKVGEHISAKVINTEGRHIELSRRILLPDPWKEFIRSHTIGDVVNGTIQALHPEGIFVKVKTGIRGFIPSSELASWKVARPDELFSIGDHVEAVIIKLIPQKKRLGLSIRARFEQIDQATEVIQRIDPETHENSIARNPDYRENAEPIISLSPEQSVKVGKVLIVEDHEDLREALWERLKTLGMVVFRCSSLLEAMTLVGENTYDLIFVDLDLSGNDGLDLIHYLNKCKDKVRCCIMSTPDILADRAEEIEKAHVDQVFVKPLNMYEVEEFISCIAQDKFLSPWIAPLQHNRDNGALFNEIFSIESEDAAPSTRLEVLLSDVTTNLGAEIGVIFRLDPGTHSFSVVSKFGESNLIENAIYGLNNSPVEDVIHEVKPLLENWVTTYAMARFANLLTLLDFEACLGVPIRLGSRTQHAAFFFHRKGGAFQPVHMEKALAAASQFAALLREEVITQQLVSINPILLSGQLAGGITHETANKISGLDIRLRNLLFSKAHKEEHQQSLNDIYQLVLDLKQTFELFQHSFYQRSHTSSVDVELVLKQAIALLHVETKKEGVRIILKPRSGLPPVWGNGVALQQVFFNLILNAVQHMTIKAKKFSWKGQRILDIRASHDVDKDLIQISFTDSGPGIHYYLWSEIFEPGFSTRDGGSGLGLFVARNLIRSFGGAVYVHESYVPFGTSFRVEIPLKRKEG